MTGENWQFTLNSTANSNWNSMARRFAATRRLPLSLGQRSSLDDAATGREVGDWWGHGLMPRGTAGGSSFRTCRSKIGTLERPDRHESRRGRPLSLASSRSFG